jgi:hypothetical protein
MALPRTIQTTSLPIFQRLEGVLAEGYFERLAREQGWEVAKATPAEDRLGWDFRIFAGELSFKVDVKCMKKIDRKDSFGQDKYAWIELSRGEETPGWLYKSQADLFAFETSREFMLVKKADLITLVNKLVDRAVVVTDKTKAVNKIFQRKKLQGKGWEDLTLIECRKIREVALECWEKPELMRDVDQQRCEHVFSSENSLHREALEAIEFRSPRLRAKKEDEIRGTIETFKYCPRCAKRIIG